MSANWKKSEHELLVRVAKAGTPYEQICKIFSRHSRRSVWQKLKNAGFEMLVPQVVSDPNGPELVNRIIDLYNEGQPLYLISQKVGKTVRSVRWYLHKAGVLVEGSQSEEYNGQMRSGPGLPPGHLKPWPEHARFDSIPVKSDPHRVAMRHQAAPLFSSGVAEYGHV